MNRQERRQQERELKKNAETIQKLTPAQTKIVDLVAREKAKIIADQYIAKFTEIIDMTLTATLLQYGLTWDRAKEIIEVFSEFTMEDMEKINNLKKEGNFEMAAKKLEFEIREEIEKLMDAGEERKEVIKKMIFKFPSASKSMITNTYARIEKEREVLKSDDPDVSEAMEKVAEIIGEDNQEAEKVMKQVEKIKVEEKVEIKTENMKENAVKEEVTAVPNRLKVKALKIDLEGENGNYAISDTGIQLKNEGCELFFNDKSQWQTFAKEIEEVFRLQEEYKKKVS